MSWRLKSLKLSSQESGFILPALLSFMVVAGILSVAVVEVTSTNVAVNANNIKSQQAFNIAEAGANYYLWHLSHNSADYKDGGTTPTTPDPVLGYGPYVHNYIDSNAKNEGTFTLYINPQGNGSSVVNVRSIGKVAGTNITRTIQTQIGQPSFASYAVASDTALWFGNTEASDGPVHSNQGVRMDGASDATITSANSSYTPTAALGGDGNSHPGVWCNLSVTSPVNCNTRSKSDWAYPEPQIDFNQVSGSLCTIKKVAFASDSSTSSLATQANACTQTPTTRTAAYLPQRSTSYSTSKGYLIQLNTNGTYDLYYVNSETDTSRPYTSALSTQSVATGIAIPSSGVIFAEDNVWVRSNPTFHGRVSIAAGRLATNDNANITIADALAYSTKNGSDAIGLIAEGSVLLAPYAPPASGAFNLEIDAAIIAETGSVEYPVIYQSSSNRYTYGWTNSNQKLNFYGSIATRQTWTWTWLVGTQQSGDDTYDPSSGYYVSGIIHNTTSYDYNLEYTPPPSYPLTSGYNILSWREILTKP